MPNQKVIVPLDTIDTALVDRPARPGRFGVLCFLNKESVLGAIGLYVSHHALAPIRLIWVRHDEGRCPFGDGNDPRAWHNGNRLRVNYRRWRVQTRGPGLHFFVDTRQMR